MQLFLCRFVKHLYLFGSIAQLEEQYPSKVSVVGSSPTGVTKKLVQWIIKFFLTIHSYEKRIR